MASGHLGVAALVGQDGGVGQARLDLVELTLQVVESVEHPVRVLGARSPAGPSTRAAPVAGQRHHLGRLGQRGGQRAG